MLTSSRQIRAALAAASLSLACAHEPPPRRELAPDQVRVVQRALRDRAAYDVPVTGAWDDTTRGAVIEFQRVNNLVMTGKLDAATARALGIDSEFAAPAGAGNR